MDFRELLLISAAHFSTRPPDASISHSSRAKLSNAIRLETSIFISPSESICKKSSISYLEFKFFDRKISHYSCFPCDAIQCAHRSDFPTVNSFAREHREQAAVKFKCLNVVSGVENFSTFSGFHRALRFNFQQSFIELSEIGFLCATVAAVKKVLTVKLSIIETIPRLITVLVQTAA